MQYSRYPNLREAYRRHGARTTVAKLAEAIQTKKVDPASLSLRELAEGMIGENWAAKLRPDNFRYVKSGVIKSIKESDIRAIPEDTGDAVDVSAFGNITGQIIYSMIHQGWDQAGMIGDKLFKNVPTKFDGEKIPGVGRITTEGRPVHPGDEFPRMGFGEQYWQTPSTAKYGLIVELTKEAIYFDHTSLITTRAQELGERLRYNKEKRQLAVFAGVTVNINGESFVGNNHVWNGTAYNTYDVSANNIGINAKTSLELSDWTDIEEAMLLFADLRDPDTGNPILIQPDLLVVQPYKLMTAKRILSATEVRHGDITTGTGIQTIGGNPVPSMEVVSSPLLYQLLQDSGIAASTAKNYWYILQKNKPFWYMENYPLTTVQAPANNEAEFTRDIVMRWKASERGVPYSADPRFCVNGRG